MFKVKIKALCLFLPQYLPCVCPLLDWGLGSSREQKALMESTYGGRHQSIILGMQFYTLTSVRKGSTGGLEESRVLPDLVWG